MPEQLIAADTASTDELRQLSSAGSLFAVLDSCDAPAVPIFAAGQDEQHCVSLYRGDAEERYWDIAPYLVHVDNADALKWILSYAATKQWGILIESAQPLDAVRQHLRKFLKVRDPDGTQMYFRFYDPLVMATFLPVCTDDQLTEFFGAVQRYGTIDAAGAITMFSRARPRMKLRRA